MKLCKQTVATLALCLALGCNGEAGSQYSDNQEWNLDQRSYNLGAIGAFSEMVDYGVKRLALSSPLDPAEMDLMIDEATRIAESHNVEIFRETDFLVTDLFSAELTEGKDVLLICDETTFQEYEALKAEKQRLENLGEYHGEARSRIARRFGELLSYPEAQIEVLLSADGNSSD